jgi:predicted secreted protein
VRLREDPSTGYGWHLVTWDEGMLKKEKEDLEPLEDSADLRVEHVWVFHPLKIG